MDELKITDGILLSIGGLVLLLLAFKLYYKYLIQEKKCTAKTKGRVKKYTSYSGGNSGVRLPIVIIRLMVKNIRLLVQNINIIKLK